MRLAKKEELQALSSLHLGLKQSKCILIERKGSFKISPFKYRLIHALTDLRIIRRISLSSMVLYSPNAECWFDLSEFVLKPFMPFRSMMRAC